MLYFVHYLKSLFTNESLSFEFESFIYSESKTTKGITVARRKKEQRIYTYECSLSGESYKLTQKIEKSDELLSVKAWYEMNPEHDDRPEDVKKKLGVTAENQ